MLQAAPRPPRIWTAADLLAEFGPIPLNRIRHDPPPGLADEAAVIEIHDRTDRCCELVDGVLLEKVMGSFESLVAITIATLLNIYVRKHKLGVVLGADGMLRLGPGHVRVPDVCFIAWERLPSRKIPRAEMWSIAPNLAVEVISRGNTALEMKRKRKDYFRSGVQLVWYVYPRKRQVAVYTSPTKHKVLKLGDTLDGGDVLPGFRVTLDEIFTDELE